jgi:hypothetical protein
MKPVILITAYCPDKKRQDLLENLIKSLPSDQFDILITSHTPIPKHIQDQVNYVFYDQENPLYHDMESAPFYWDQLKNCSGYIYHTKLHNPLHILAILRLERFGYQIAKMLGYEKLHCLEYDALVLNSSIFNINNTLLDSYSAVIYENEELGNNSMHGSFKSMNISHLPNELLEYNKSKIKNYFKTNKSRILPEQYYFDLFSKLNIIKQSSNKFTSSIQAGLNSTGVTPFQIIPHTRDKNLMLYYNDSSNNLINFTLQLDDHIEEVTIKPLVWVYKPLGVFKDFSYIKVTVQNKLYFELDFNKDNNREIFSKRHLYTKHV